MAAPPRLAMLAEETMDASEAVDAAGCMPPSLVTVTRWFSTSHCSLVRADQNSVQGGRMRWGGQGREAQG